MSTNLSLEVQLREVTGKKVKYLRQQGVLPATVYGKGFDPVSIQIDDRTFNTIYRKVGRTTLLDLHVPGRETQAAFVHDVQRHPVTRTIIHADFRVVDLKTAIQTAVPIVLVNESPMVARGDAVINPGITQVEVQALPQDIPVNLEVDIRVLDSIDKSLYVRDVPMSETYTILTNPDELIVSLAPTRKLIMTQQAAKS